MGFLDALKRFFVGSGGGSQGDSTGLYLYFKCNKCGSIVRVRVHKHNDLNRADGPGTFLLRKEVMDSQCFQIMSAEIWLDSSYQVVTADVTNGELVSEEAYKAAQAA